MDILVNYKTRIGDIELNGEKVIYIEDYCNDKTIMEDIILEKLVESFDGEFDNIEIIWFESVIDYSVRVSDIGV